MTLFPITKTNALSLTDSRVAHADQEESCGSQGERYKVRRDKHYDSAGDSGVNLWDRDGSVQATRLCDISAYKAGGLKCEIGIDNFLRFVKVTKSGRWTYGCGRDWWMVAPSRSGRAE